MIRAADFLRLPNAQISEKEQAAFETEVLPQIEARLRAAGKYDGVELEFPGITRHYAVRLTHMLEPLGWICTWVYWEKPSKYSSNIMQRGFTLQLQPNDKAYEEAGLLVKALALPVPSEN